ncbi:flagellar calcium-binding protein [Trypanosoma theileri]|uniref:Flagellar calcium-binding protein n=1 Tax=Trypanosoma theileri TaxID=67003 RepID=A0A1X0NZ95_9TRYP|nr:flagellar calcium-binding protein [Trypanosoma theileri]ORC89921.1 flagellar calcium-binding protein [Trypanosoma theileri]
MGLCGSKNSTSSKEGKSAQDRKVAWERIRQAIPREKTPEAKQRRIDLFKKFDKNNSGKLSYNEVYEGCLNVLKLDEFTSRLRDITKRAFNKAKDMGNKVENKGSEDYVEFLEFRLFLCYVYDYFELTVMFDEIDTSGNMLLDENEFKKAAPKLEEWGAKIDDPSKVFKELDKNGSGAVTFDEFAAWASARKLDVDGDPDNVPGNS